MSASTVAIKTPDVSGRLTYMMQQLRTSVLCPVCLDVPNERPIFSCPNGHIVCSTCKRNECPTCRAAMGSMRNRVAENVINVIDHECSHDGCAEQIPLSQLHQHEEDCPFKPILCPAASCNEYVIMSRFVTHLQRKHQHSEGFGEFIRSFVIERGNKLDIKFLWLPIGSFVFKRGIELNVELLLDPEGRNGWKCFVVRWENRSFILCVEISNNWTQLYVFMIGRKKDLKNYKVETSVTGITYCDELFEREREEFSLSLKCPPNYLENKDNARRLFVSKDMLYDVDCVEVCLRFEKTA